MSSFQSFLIVRGCLRKWRGIRTDEGVSGQRLTRARDTKLNICFVTIAGYVRSNVIRCRSQVDLPFCADNDDKFDFADRLRPPTIGEFFIPVNLIWPTAKGCSGACQDDDGMRSGLTEVVRSRAWDPLTINYWR